MLWKVLTGKIISAKKVKSPHGFPLVLLYLTEVQASGRFSFWVCFLVLLELQASGRFRFVTQTGCVVEGSVWENQLTKKR